MKMKKKAYRVLASADIPVVAGFSDNTKEVVLANHKCPHCKTTVAANKMHSTACPVCAHTMQPISNKTISLSRKELKSLSLLGDCPDCGTHLSADSRVVSALKGSEIHCIVCSTPLEVSDDSSDDELLDADTSMDDSVDDSSVEEDDSMGESEDFPDEMPSDDFSDDEEDEEDISTVESEADDLPEIGEDMGDEEEDLDSSPIPDIDDEEEDSEDTSTVEAEDAEHPDFEEVSDDTTEAPTEDVDSEDTSDEITDLDVPVDDTSDENSDEFVAEARLIDFIKGGSEFELVMAGADPANRRYYLFVNEVPVAIATKANAKPEIQSLYGTEKYVKAFNTIASEDLSSESIKDFGFQPITVEVPVDEAVQKQTEDLIKQKDAEVQAALKTLKSNFERAIGIAAVGVNKGIFSGDCQIKAYLVNELEKARFRGASRVVDAAFSQHGEEYLRTIITKASELSTKTEAALDEIAEMVSVATYRNTVESSVTPTVEKETFVPFSTMASAEEHTPVKASKDDDFTSQLNAVMAGLGNRFV